MAYAQWNFGIAFGCCVWNHLQNSSLSQMQDLGVEVNRIDVEWDRYEPTPGNRDFSVLDAIVDAHHARGIDLIFTVYYPPSWAREGGPKSPITVAAASQWQAFLTALVTRYKNRGRGVHHYEIWNEPNLEGFFPGGNATKYVTQCLSPAYTAIKAADPSAVVISAGLAPQEGFGSTLPRHPIQFLKDMYAAGLSSVCDAIGMHPYNDGFGPTPSASTIATSTNQFAYMYIRDDTDTRTARGVMRANGDAGKQIYATEWGFRMTPCNPCTGYQGKRASTSVAADILPAYQMMVTRPHCGPLCTYALRDEGIGDSDFGLTYGAAGTPKPGVYDAWKAARAAVGPGTGATTAPPPPEPPPTPDKAYGRPTYASSSESALLVPSNAVDANTGTRWGSDYEHDADPDSAWIYVDLGEDTYVEQFWILWETAYAVAYKIQVAQDGDDPSASSSDWVDVVTVTDGGGGLDEHTIDPVVARYVRILCQDRGTQWGYSIWDFQVRGSSGPISPTSGGSGVDEDYALGILRLISEGEPSVIPDDRVVKVIIGRELRPIWERRVTDEQGRPTSAIAYEWSDGTWRDEPQ